ncbi:asparagine synthase (glutamine-hydrolyzing) [candidate division KSB1 bacterium]|nr:asparagine synthase (glutamine-hydrolyzing) [candidate division KSB1 bacterium]
MSGICGIIENSPNSNLKDQIIEMTRQLIHRGPDGENFYHHENAAFGEKVMKVFYNAFPSEPITNEDKTLYLFADGEIYEYAELRKHLEAKGHQFKNLGDCEVLIHLYEEMGENLARNLRGVFAFAIWDTRTKKLLLYRDHMGVKPLYYTYQNNRFLFGSEMKAFLVDKDVKRELNFNALDHYLNYRLIFEPETIYNNIFKLPPGHYLIFQNNKLEIKQYWEIVYNENYVKSSAEYQEELIRLLGESIRIRKMGDFAFGSYLSGGMDSSSVVVLLSKMIDYPLPTFSMAFKEKGYDESYYQHVVANFAKSDHHQFIVEPESVEELVQNLIGYFDQPFGDSSALPSYYLAKMTRKNVAMVFTGDGGDELLAGYTTYPGMLYSEKYRSLPKFLSHGLIPGLINFAGMILPKKYAYDIERYKKVIGDALLPFEERYMQKISIARRDLRYRLYNEMTKSKIMEDNEKAGWKFFVKNHAHEVINRINYVDVYFRFMNTVLPKTECTAMANSLITRSPYLDHKLVEFGASVPPHLKVHKFQTKRLLHLAMDDKLPREIHVKQKHGFIPPLTVWFKDELGSYIRRMLLAPDSRVLNYFNRNELEKLLQIHESGTKDLGEHLWGVLGFEVWHRLYLG